MHKIKMSDTVMIIQSELCLKCELNRSLYKVFMETFLTYFSVLNKLEQLLFFLLTLG